MKLKSIAVVSASLAISLTAAFAVPDNNAKTQSLVDVSKLEGTDVWDFHGNKLGALEQVLIDPQTGRIRYGVMEVDKSWNWTDPQVAVPWDLFAVKRGDDQKTVLSIDATKEKLQNAPKFKTGDADRLFSKDESQPIYTYWSVYWFEEPSTTPNTSSNASNNRSDASANASDSGKSDANANASTNTKTDANANASANDQSGQANKTNEDVNRQGNTGSAGNTASPAQNQQTASPKD